MTDVFGVAGTGIRVNTSKDNLWLELKKKLLIVNYIYLYEYVLL